MLSYITNKIKNHYKQILRYSIIGILCFLVNYAVAIILEKYIYSMVSATIGYSIGVLLNYILSIKWVFEKRELEKEWKKELVYFTLIEICAWILMLSSLYILENLLNVKFEIAIIPANFIAAVWNYSAKYFFLFRKHPVHKNKL